MPTRFLNNININDSYTMPAADGTADQIISTDGAGQLSFIDQTTLSAESAEVVKVPVKNLQGSALTKGDPVYISGSVGTSGRLEVKLADAGDTTKMPALGLLEQDLGINGEGYAVVTGKLRNLVTSPIDGATPSEGEVVYVKSNGTTGAALTTTKPIGVNLIQNMGKVGRASTSNDGTFIVSSILRSNDVPTPIYIDHAFQKVGIGETSPDEILHIKGPTPKIKLEHSSGYFESKVEFYSTTGKAGELAAYNNPGFQGVILSYDMGTPTTRFQVETNKFRLITSDPANYQAEVFIDEYIVHEGDPDTKFGFVANDNFAITTAGSERVRVTSGGSVGIATNNPGAKLDVEGNAVIGAAGNTVSGAFGVAINKNTVVTSEDGFAQGENTIATGRQGAAFGFNTYANGAASIAGGALSETNAQRSIAVGATAITNAEDSAAFNTGTRANGLFSFATGQGCFATNNAAFATGSNTQATGLYSFSGGVNSIASGNGAVALGGGAQCSGEFSFAAGNINVASGINSTALGFDNDAIGAHSTVIGHLNTTSAAAAYGVAINFQNTVSGQGAFAFNQGNTVSGLNAASGGVSNTVTAEASFAYGFGIDTSGGGATPPQQILFGRFLKPPRDTAGNAGEAQVIVGRHNKHANQPATAFAVGTGTASNATANSFTVQYDGNVLMEQVLNKNYSSDSAAAAGGVPIGGIYHNAGDLKIRRT